MPTNRDDPDATRARKRMPAADRRDQMLGVAMRFIRAEGVGALTLARLADASGVSKPIAYQHFGTREDLLAALYAALGREQEIVAAVAIAAGASGDMPRDTVATALATAFVDCVLENGRLFTEIGAAIVASGDNHQAARADFGRRYTALLSPFIGGDAKTVFAFAVAFLGAGDGLSAAVQRGDLDRDRAIAVLRALLLATPRSDGSDETTAQ